MDGPFTRIMSRLSTALSNRPIWLYFRIKIFMSTPLPSTQKHKNEKMTLICMRGYVHVCQYVYAFMYMATYYNL